jgi:hypothetical protein
MEQEAKQRAWLQDAMHDRREGRGYHSTRSHHDDTTPGAPDKQVRSEVHNVVEALSSAVPTAEQGRVFQFLTSTDTDVAVPEALVRLLEDIYSGQCQCPNGVNRDFVIEMRNRVSEVRAARDQARIVAAHRVPAVTELPPDCICLDDETYYKYLDQSTDVYVFFPVDQCDTFLSENYTW